jgi:hypothetical protein
MNNIQLQIKIKERLNKLASMDYDNIECWQIAEAFNKAQLGFVRRQVHGVNQTKEGDESTKVLIDDLQCLLHEEPLTGSNLQVFFQSADLPGDYLFYKSVTASSKTDCCPDRRLVVYLAPVADVTNLLFDQLRSPSAEWGETFCTLSDNKIKIYHDGKFEVVNAKLNYYRNPTPVEFAGCINLATGAASTQEVECEFKDDVAELIVDEAASILAGDMESVLQFQRTQASSTQNN